MTPGSSNKLMLGIMAGLHCGQEAQYAAQASKVKLRARLAAAPPDLRADIASSDSACKYLFFLTLINAQVPHQLLQLEHLKRCDPAAAGPASPCGRRVLDTC